MTTKQERIDLALARLLESQADIDEAVAAHHKAFVACLKVGCTQSQMAATLGVSRQTVSEYVRRWCRTAAVPAKGSQSTLF